MSGIKIIPHGFNKKIGLFDIMGWLDSFKKSLIASAKGTIKPSGPGLFGPLRVWI